jgi:hypothetical protein
MPEFYERTLGSFTDEIITSVRQGNDNQLWYAVLDVGPVSYPSDPDFSTCATTREAAVARCARKIRDDAIGLGKYAPHDILTGYALHWRLMKHWAEKCEP